MPALGELLATGLLSRAADEVELVGGNRNDDIRARIGGLRFVVEVKTAWWHDAEQTVVGHSPLRAAQTPDLVALVGKFDVSESHPTLKNLDENSLTIEPDRLFYLVPTRIIRVQSAVDGKSTARSLIPADVVVPFGVDLEQGISTERLLRLLADE